MDSEWTVYFQTVAGVSVTALGVLFIAIQVSASRSGWMELPIKRAEAASDMAELLIPLLASLLFLIPGHPWRVALVVTGLLGLAVWCHHWMVYRRTNALPEPMRSAAIKAFDKNQTRWNWISFAVYSWFVVSGATGLDWMHIAAAWACTWLVFSGSTEGWWLMLDVTRTAGNATVPPSPVDVQTSEPSADPNVDDTGSIASDQT